MKFALVCASCWAAMGACAGWAEPAVMRKFNGPDKAWQLMTGPAPAQILTQEFVQGGVRDATVFERVVVAAPPGQTAFLFCPIARVAVLEELQVRLWVTSSRPDVQLAVRVVLPRSLDAQKRGAATAIVRGSVYNRPGKWQELRVAEVPRLLADQVRVMRVTPGASIDPHEAYIDAIVLLVPGNGSGTDVGADDLAVDGVVLTAPVSGAVAAGAVQPAGKHLGAGGKRAGSNRLAARTVAQSGVAAAPQPPGVARENVVSATKAATVRLQGTSLSVDGRPFLPRVIQWNGEPLEFLANCGFNVVQLSGSPTPEQSAQAEKLGLWFLATPEHPDALARVGVGRAGDRVIAWQLRDDALEVDSNYSMRWAEAVRERDAVFGRPVVIMPVANWAAVNKSADILIARQPRTGPVRPLEFAAWLEVCSQKAQPGTPLWIGVSTQTDETVRRQIGALTHANTPSLNVDPLQLESHLKIACAHNPRGFVFQSTSSLAGVDDATQQRVAALQLINRRLQLIEPWLAGGKAVSQVTSLDSAEIGVLLHVDRARLLVPLPNERRQLDKVGAGKGRPAPKEIVFVVPGVPETSQVFYFSPTTMRTLSSERIAGGTRMAMPAAGDGYIVMTEDPQVIQSLQQRVARDGGKTVQLERELAARRARAMAYSSQRLAQFGLNAEVAAREAAVVNQQMALVDTELAAGRAESAHDAIAALMKQIEKVTAEQRLAVATPMLLESNPLAAFSDTLPEFAAFERSLTSLRPGENLLPGGDFEDIKQMTSVGWQHLETVVENVQASAQLSAVQAKQGGYCLDLTTKVDSASVHPLVAANLVSIVSPEVPVSQNQLIEISGWVRVDGPFSGGEGLEIVDSLGGPALSLVVNQTAGWQPFRMIRAVTEPVQLRLTFSLTGLGSAKVDGVMIRTLEQPIARRLPPAPPTGAATGISTAAATNINAAGAGGGPGLFAPPTR
jgi:hypothetical protein